MGINDYIQIGKRIKELRKKNTNFSQKEMAAQLKIPVSTYSGYENNHREPSSEMLTKIADILGISLERLIGIDLTDEELAAVVADNMFNIAGFEVDLLENGQYMISNYDEHFYFYASQEEVEKIIDNAAGLMAYELDKLKKTKEVIYEDQRDPDGSK